MSLTVPPALLNAAERGPVDDAEFIACVRDSLPYAFQTVRRVVAELAATGADHADDAVPPPTEADRGQLLRALASDAIRGGLERHFNVRLAFQNCHRVAAFRPAAVDSEAYRRFVSARGQLLNQSPELRNC
ncbi:SCO5389 family protein [Micromonospora sp. LZ34]